MSTESTHAQKAKRTHYRNTITRIQKNVDDDAIFNAWTKGQLKENFNKIKESQANLDEAVIAITCDEEQIDPAFTSENDAFDDVIMRIKAKISDKLDELNNANGNANQGEQFKLKDLKELTIEVQATDAAGNIPNTWGTFDGDYSKWQSFRDRWLSCMHENRKVKTIVKFQNLKAGAGGI